MGSSSIIHRQSTCTVTAYITDHSSLPLLCLQLHHSLNNRLSGTGSADTCLGYAQFLAGRQKQRTDRYCHKHFLPPEKDKTFFRHHNKITPRQSQNPAWHYTGQLS